MEVALRQGRLNTVLGTELTFDQTESTLNRLQFKYKREAEQFIVEVPSRRQDITREVDLMEEVWLHGYDHIPTSLPKGPTTRGN